MDLGCARLDVIDYYFSNSSRKSDIAFQSLGMMLLVRSSRAFRPL